MGDELDQLLLRHTILDGAREVKVHLLGLAEGDERRAGDEAPVALRQLRALPDVAEEHLSVSSTSLGAVSASGFFILVPPMPRGARASLSRCARPWRGSPPLPSRAE